MIFAGDLLRPQMLLHRHRIIGAAFDGGVIANDHHIAARHTANPRNHARGMDIPVIKPIGCQSANFQKGGSGIQQAADPIPRQKFAARHMPRPCPFRPALGGKASLRAQIMDQRLPSLAIGFGLLRLCIELRCQHGHFRSSLPFHR